MFDRYDMDGGMAPKKRRNRTISHDALALRHAVQCSIPSLRKAAIDHVRQVIREEGGIVAAIAERFGIARSTWWEWVQAVPEIQKSYFQERPDNASGPKPAALGD